MIGKLFILLLRLVTVPAFLLMPLLLYTSEGGDRATEIMLEEAKERLVVLESLQPDPANDGQLVHLTGEPVTAAPLVDDLTGLQVDGFVLERQVEMYQWKRRLRSKFVREIRYIKVWSDALIDSSEFPSEHQNPREILYPPSLQMAESARLGGFTLSRELVEKLDDFEPVPIEATRVEALNERLWGPVKLIDGVLYFGRDNPDNPHIGNVRITYRYVPRPEVVSIIASQQPDGRLGPYTASNGETLVVLRKGGLKPKKMWEMQELARGGQLWFQRIFGFIVMLLALRIFIATFRDGSKAPGWITSVRQRGSWRFALCISFGIGLIAIGAGKMAVFLMTSLGLCAIGALLLAFGFRFMVRP